MARWPDDVAGLRSAWAGLMGEWERADSRARSLGDEAAQRRVADEWSYVETSRHLVFVVDLWIRRAVLDDAHPFHAEGLPPTFVPPSVFPGVEPSREVSLEQAIDLRRHSETMVEALLAGLDDEGLRRRCGRDGEHDVLRCVRTVCNEADLHRQFAVRDLTVLEAG
jgi:hypothetical protein